jgi:catechol 2,3-dioxygenase-like lactoylglutathione lyase family enzyme
MKSPIKVVEFAFVVYPVADQARARAFYEGILGFTSTTNFQEGEQFWVEYEVGPHTLGIGNEPFLKPCGDGPHLVLEVENFEETIKHLKCNNVPFALEPTLMPPGCRAAIVTDPDGNKLGIHQRKS